MKGPLTSEFDSHDSGDHGTSVRPLSRRLRRSLALVRTAYRDQKLPELSSFAIWEALHRLHLYRTDRYVSFTDDGVLTLEDQDVTGLDRSAAGRFWEQQGLAVRPATSDWKVLVASGDDWIGTLASSPSVVRHTRKQGGSPTPVHDFGSEVESVFADRRKTIFVGVRGSVHRRLDTGGAFEEVLRLSTPQSYFRRSVGMTETPGGLLILGEYGNVRHGRDWANVANLYTSSDGGSSWERSEFLKQRGANKHVHFVWYSDVLEAVLIADGDNKKRLWISDPINPGAASLPKLNLINRFHLQMGGHTAVAELEGRVILGTDYMGGTNFLLDTADGRAFRKRIVPDPYRQSPIMQLVKRRSRDGIELWALLPYSSSRSRSLLMFSRDGGQSWVRTVEYDHRHGVQVVSSSADIQDVLYVSFTDRTRDVRAVYAIGDAA